MAMTGLRSLPETSGRARDNRARPVVVNTTTMKQTHTAHKKLRFRGDRGGVGR